MRQLFTSESLVDRCDESKCLSTGLAPPNDADAESEQLFNCWAQGPGTLFPYMCADGYTGVPVPGWESDSNDGVHYFTCCPGSGNPDPPPVRECGNTRALDAGDSNYRDDQSPADVLETLCSTSAGLPYGRFMTFLPGLPRSYLCCSVDLDEGSSQDGSSQDEMPEGPVGESATVGTDRANSTGLESSTYGDDVGGGLDPNEYSGLGSGSDCMANVFCGDCTVTNTFGNIQVMNCYSDVYRFPVIVETDGNTATYECCMSDPSAATQPCVFVVDSAAYRATVWTQFALAVVASAMSVLLITAVGRSLLRARRSAKTKPNAAKHSGSDYSSYNLYLVLLAIPDLAYNVFLMGIVSVHFQNGWIPQLDPIITFCATSNQYLNAVIAREVLVLLQTTKACRKHSPPTLARAGLQFLAVSVYASLLAIAWYFLLYHDSDGTERSTVSIPMRRLTVPIFYVLVVAIPAVYLIWVCFVIWRQQLLPKGQIGWTKQATTTAAAAIPSNSRKTNSNSNSNSKTNSNTNHGNGSSNSGHRNSSEPGDSVSAHPTAHTVATMQQQQQQEQASVKSERRWNWHSHSTTGNVSHRTTTTTARSYRTTTTTTTTTAATTARTGRLNVLAVYFARIILVFFLVWLPGMIMYYIAYQPNKNAASLMHNVGLIFLSLQAILSNAMAMSKPDVARAIRELLRLFCPPRNNSNNNNSNNNGAEEAEASRSPQGRGYGCGSSCHRRPKKGLLRKDGRVVVSHPTDDAEAPKQTSGVTVDHAGRIVTTNPHTFATDEDPVSTITTGTTSSCAIGANGYSHAEVTTIHEDEPYPTESEGTKAP